MGKTLIVSNIFKHVVRANKYENNDKITKVIITKSVMDIETAAFKNCKNLKTVIIGNGVTYISESAFEGCENLTTVKMGENVEYLSANAFKDCKNLTTIEFPTSLTCINSSAFEGCESLTEITLGDKMKEIMSSAFQNCKNLKTVTLNGVRCINSSAFEGCENLTTVDTGKRLYAICEKAFSGCKNLTTINLPNTLVYIRKNAFENCQSLVDLTLPNGVYEVQGSAFIGTGLYNNKENWVDNGFYLGTRLISTNDDVKGEFIVKEGTKTISVDAFKGNKNLVSVVMPDTVRTIVDGAFEDCENLEKITFGKEIKNIGLNVFKNCVKLNSIIVPTLETLPKNAFEDTGVYNIDDNYENGVLYIGGWAIIAKRDISGSIVLKDDIIGIYDGAFEGCENLTEITIPKSVKYINNKAFQFCNKLEKVNYLGSVDDWAQISFGNKICSFSNPFEIPMVKLFIDNELVENVNITKPTEIKPYVFKGYSHLKNLTVGGNVNVINQKAFEECLKLETVNILDSVTKVKDNVFDYCISLKNVTIGKGLTDIPTYAFKYCNQLEKITCLNENNEYNFVGEDNIKVTKENGNYYFNKE